MNIIRGRNFNIIKSYLGKEKNILKIIKKGKFRGPYQPGLSRYDYNNEEYQPLPFERSRLTHVSDAEELISRIPVVEVDDNIVLCYGISEYGWGHPIEYINLNIRNIKDPVTCKYCGLKYVRREGSVHH